MILVLITPQIITHLFIFAEPATRDLFPAPVCQSSQKSVRLYDNTCRCARGSAAVSLGPTGRARGNCSGLDEDIGDNLDKVWCFLENVRDPRNPGSGCYTDIRWSEKDGRFWSSKACFEVQQKIEQQLKLNGCCNCFSIVLYYIAKSCETLLIMILSTKKSILLPVPFLLGALNT